MNYYTMHMIWVVSVLAVLGGTGASVIVALRTARADKPTITPWLTSVGVATGVAWACACALALVLRGDDAVVFVGGAGVGGLLPVALSFPFIRPALGRMDLKFDAKTRLLLGLAAGALLGVPVSQYAPMFGGFEKMGEPWSRARMSLIGVHVLVFAVVGGGLGYLVTWLKTKQAAPPAPPPAPNVGPSADAASRLAENDRLLSQGLITKDEHAVKRTDILKSV